MSPDTELYRAFFSGLVKNILSANFWIPLSRINYAAYILHFAVTKAIIYNIETPIHFDTFAYVSNINIPKFIIVEHHKQHSTISHYTKGHLTAQSTDH